MIPFKKISFSVPVMEAEELSLAPGATKNSILVVRQEFRVTVASAVELLEGYYTNSDFTNAEKQGLAAELVHIKTAIAAILKYMNRENPDAKIILAALNDLDSAWSNYKMRAANILKLRESRPQMPQELSQARSILHSAEKQVKSFLKGKSKKSRGHKEVVAVEVEEPIAVEEPHPEEPEHLSIAELEPEIITKDSDQHQEKIAELKQEILASQNRHKEAQKRLRTLAKELAGYRERDNNTDLLGDINEEFKNLLLQQKNDLTRKMRESEESIDELNLLIETTERTTDIQILQLNAEADAIRKEHQSYLKEIATSKQLKSALEREFYAINSAMEEKHSEINKENSKTSDVQSLIEEFTARKDANSTRIAELKQQAEELTAICTELEEELSEIKHKRRNGDDFSRAFEKWDSLEDEIARLKRRHHELRKVIIPDMRFQIDRASTEVGKLAIALQKQNGEFAALNMEMINRKVMEMFPM